MSYHSSKTKAEIFDAKYATANDEAHVELRQIAADNLQPFACHSAGGGSEYVYIGDFKIRFADHENISSKHDYPDVNCVDRNLSDAELIGIRAKIGYPEMAKKTALAKYVGLTVPALKKHLTPDCYEQVVVDPINYPNIKYEFVRVTPALDLLTQAGVTKRVPIAQETWSVEDYHPGYY
jgi:hypothetical protein